MARSERVLLGLVLGLLILVAGKASWIEAKAWVAQALIARAWERTLAEGGHHPPWPWADTWPVARLADNNGKDLYILESASGQALAFGPGRMAATGGGWVVAGHRDTHFRFLEGLEKDDRLSLQKADGGWTRYRVAATKVADTRRDSLQPPEDPQALALVTCYPFDASAAGGPLRYVVRMEPVARAESVVSAETLSGRGYPGR
ncbi:class GN sortase [Alloalcanivorax xenomutans]|uniref:class GN sortase n=1 Tax=Alloalcanivorax xenomutans TaxID=1094342 RepID=UPI0024E1C3EE|nr:class GN sortase [Alloalcanivorax xenomutans]